MQLGGRLAGGGEWPLGAQTTIAFYHSVANEVIIPAGILQPPYFDPAASDAVNYGAIGAVIGHEAGHALDASGRQIPRGLSAESWNDVVGLAVAWEAYKRSRATAGTEVSSSDQRLFVESWARIWRELVRPEFQRRLALLPGQYPPGDVRANSAVAHLEAFYRAFDVSPGDRLFIAPERRIRVF
jgi:putative endopeptidase